MIVISDCSKDIVIPAGLGDNAGVVYEKSGVESLNGQQGDLTLKTVNGNELLGEGDVAIDTGVESLNGQKGALTLKTVNGNELTGEGDIEIKGGVETVNGETGDVKIKTVNGQSLMGEGDVPVDVGVETLNGQKGNLKIKSVNGAEMLGEGNVAIDTGVESLNGQKGALTLKTVNGNDMLGDGNIEIQAGSDSVIVLDGLTQEERKAVYDKLDKSVPPKEVFKYNGAVSFYTYWGGGNYLKIFFLDETYGGGRVKQWSLDPDGWFSEEGIGMNYPNFLFLNVGDHAAEGADFECGYTGDYNEFMRRPYTEPNGYFLVLKKGIGDSTKKMVLPLTVLWDKEYDGSENIPIRIQFTANEKLYTYLHDSSQENKWLFESAKPIGGVQSSEVSNIKVLTQSEYDALTTKDENVLYCIKG